MPDLLLQPVPHQEAAKWIADKPILARQAFDRLLPDLKARAFTITGVEAANVVQNVRDRIAELPQGADWEKVKADIAAQISPWLDEGAEENAAGQGSGLSASQRRAELLMRVHGFQAYTVAAEDVASRQRDVFPFAQYMTVEDDKVRESHAALDGLVVPADSPFWDLHTPPWEWGCRCNKVYLQTEDVAQMQEEDVRKKPEARRVLTGDRLARLENSNQVTIAGTGGMPQFVSVSPSKTFTFDRTTIRMSAKDLKTRYDAQTWKTFETWARQQTIETGQTVWTWLMKTPAAARNAQRPTPIIPPPAPAVPAPLAAEPPAPAAPVAPAVVPRRAPVSAALEVKTAESHKTQIDAAIAAVDRVHDDGELPAVPINDRAGHSLGIYQFTREGKAVQIGTRNAPEQWPAMTTVHELGHFLDHQVLGRAGEFASVAHEDLAAFRTAVQDSQAIEEIKSLPRYMQGEFLKPYELWARAYAQYIAQKSGDPLLLEQLARIRGGREPWRQWSEEDFKPIAAEIDRVLQKKGWIA